MNLQKQKEKAIKLTKDYVLLKQLFYKLLSELLNKNKYTDIYSIKAEEIKSIILLDKVIYDNNNITINIFGNTFILELNTITYDSNLIGFIAIKEDFKDICPVIFTIHFNTEGFLVFEFGDTYLCQIGNPGNTYTKYFGDYVITDNKLDCDYVLSTIINERFKN